MSDRAAIFYYVARIAEDDSAEPIDVTQRVEEFTFTDREGGMDRLVLTINNSDLANFDDPVFEYGANLRVAFGNGKSASPVRDMVIRKVVGGRSLTVTAVSRKGSAMDTIKRRRRFENVRRSDVVLQLARENGFKAPDVEETPEIFPSIAQSNLTDAQLMRKLASLEGFELFVDYDGLHWHRRRVDQAPTREYIYFIDPAGGEIKDFNVENDVTRRPGRVTVKSRDPMSKEDIEASASNSEDTGRDTLSEYVGTIDNEVGTLIVKEEIVQETTVASNAQTQEDADREAKGKYRKTQQGVVKMTLDLRGDPSLVAKTVILVSNMGRRLSGKYYIKEIVHALSASGGYDMTVKLITDGFQGGAGSGGSGGSGDVNSLAGVAETLRLTANGEVSADIEGEGGAFVAVDTRQVQVAKSAATYSHLLQAIAQQSGNELSKNAKRASSGLLQLASNARNAKMPETAVAAANAAALCQRLAEHPEQIKSEGKTNDKAVNTNDVRPVDSVNSDGEPVTTYVNTGGREK